MKTLWIFNAGHEDSLKQKVKSYQSPKKEVGEIRRSLWPLMKFFAEKDDYFFSGETLPNLYGSVKDFYGNNVNISALDINLKVEFWAYDPKMKNYIDRLFAKEGISLHFHSIDDDKYIALSHRRFARDMMRGLADMLDISYLNDIKAEHYLIDDSKNLEMEFDRFYHQIQGYQNIYDEIVLKLPYSSSGRAVFRYPIKTTKEEIRELWQTISKFKDFSVEALLEKRSDWATEFYIDENGEVHFINISQFFVEATARYQGNIIDSQDEIRKRLSESFSEANLNDIIQAQKEILKKELAPFYHGFVGIDMLVFEDKKSKKHLIYPAVEVNIRATMGLIADYIYRFYKNRSTYKIIYHSKGLEDFAINNPHIQIINREVKDAKFIAILL